MSLLYMPALAKEKATIVKRGGSALLEFETTDSESP